MTYLTRFARYHSAKLPRIALDELDFAIRQRKKRGSCTLANLAQFESDAMSRVLKYSPVIESKFPFVDARNDAPRKVQVHSYGRGSVELSHEALMSDEKIELLARNLTENFTHIIQLIEIVEAEDGFLNALCEAYQQISYELERVCLVPPKVAQKHKTLEAAERDYSSALFRCLDIAYLVRKFAHLRNQYIEFSQIAFSRVGKGSGKNLYVSARSFAHWKQKQREGLAFIESMAIVSEETGESFDLSEVVKRTTANPENRRIELVVRSRGDEERAIDLGFVGLFVTWTLPSKYHRNSKKWAGYSPKEAHNALMAKWRRVRALLKKHDIEWFGLRVAEPHKDATPHAHLFLYVAEHQKEQLKNIIIDEAICEDRAELGSDISKRIDIKPCDPAQGTATGYIIKYISKNINGAHMPEDNADELAFRVRAWASTHRIKQFSQGGSPCVGLWRQLRRASKEETAFCEQLEALRDHADNSRWKGFCELGAAAKLAYEEKFNKYGETVKRVIGINWFGRVVATCSEKFRLVRKEVLQRTSRGAAPWSTENKCNHSKIEEVTSLEKSLMTLTGWSVKGVKWMIKPLMNGRKIAVDADASQFVQLRNNRLVIT